MRWLIFLLLLSTASAVPSLELQSLSVSNEYVFNTPIIKAVYKNTGDNSTTLINHSLQITKNYIIASFIPDFIEAGETWTLLYNIEQLQCADYNTNLAYIMNVSYTTPDGPVTQTNSSSFTALRPLEIVSTSPDPAKGFTIFIGEAANLLFDIFNNGTSDRTFNFSKVRAPNDLYLKFNDHIKEYQLRDFENTTFTLRGKDRISFRVRMTPTEANNNFMEFNLNYNETCTAMSNELDFYVSAKTKVSNVIDVVITDEIGARELIALFIISGLYVSSISAKRK